MYDEIYREINKILQDGGQAALATITSASGSTPREQGAKMLIKSDGTILGTIGGGSIERRILEEAKEVIDRGRFKNLSYTLKDGGELGMICGGNTEVTIEPIMSSPDLFIIGGGHIALALCKIADVAGFRIHVVDSRPEYASKERFAGAEVMVSDYETVFSKLKVTKNGYVVIVTHGHKGDSAALEGALSTPAAYIGMIGSRTKNAIVFQKLQEKGVSKDNLDRVHAPIGLPIHAQTPGEIAVSILAEVIKARREAEDN